jgi:hypothetical protein
MELFNEETFKNTKFNNLLPLKCDVCGKEYTSTKRSIYTSRKRGCKGNTCSGECRSKHKIANTEHINHPINTTCKNCGKPIQKYSNQVNKYKNQFCSRSCAATYNNTHKTKGNRRSKLEVWLEDQLPLLYPNIEIHFNRKDAINSELDIYFPTLNLAIELNGIFHYEPIYGESKLEKIQNNDNRKFQACLEQGIELCIIQNRPRGGVVIFCL